MSHWADGPMAGLDFETTGTDPAEARVVQAAFVLIEADGSVAEESTSFLVNPGIEIPAAASAIHGLTTDHVRALGCSTETMVCTMIDRMQDLGVVDGRVPLVIFNARFDWPLLLAEAGRCRRSVNFAPELLDPLVIDRRVDRYRKGPRTLENVAAVWRVALVNAHKAASDAVAAVAIMRAILVQWPQLRSKTLSEIQEWQARWYEEWRDHLNAYWEKIGKADRIVGGWPMGGANEASSRAGAEAVVR